jgi:hypothetical protein
MCNRIESQEKYFKNQLICADLQACHLFLFFRLKHECLVNDQVMKAFQILFLN